MFFFSLNIHKEDLFMQCKKSITVLMPQAKLNVSLGGVVSLSAYTLQ